MKLPVEQVLNNKEDQIEPVGQRLLQMSSFPVFREDNTVCVRLELMKVNK